MKPANPSRLSVGRQIPAVLGWVLICFAAASLGGVFRPGEWYALLKKPIWNPPPWIFGPVWTALYTMMAVAAWLVWKRGGFASQCTALSLFLLQLLLNALWPPLCFGARSLGFGLADIVLLWLALTATVLAFYRAYRLAGALLVPYLGWVTFASALNFTLWRLNP